MSFYRLLGWQIALLAALVGLAWATRRGAPLSLLAGGALASSSFLLQAGATGLVLQPGRRRAVGMGLFLTKLALLIVVAAAALKTSILAPMSFAAGVTTLILAIVAETCYRALTATPGA